jgi:hypothetical protein
MGVIQYIPDMPRPLPGHARAQRGDARTATEEAGTSSIRSDKNKDKDKKSIKSPGNGRATSCSPFFPFYFVVWESFQSCFTTFGSNLVVLKSEYILSSMSLYNNII